jgi:hypothetical protein
MGLPTFRLNSSAALGHQASLVSPAGGQGSGTVANRDRDQVEAAIERFAQVGSGDIKILAGEGRQLRLRVEDW